MVNRRALLAVAAVAGVGSAAFRIPSSAAADLMVAVGGEVEKAAEFSAADLAAMPQTEVKGAWSDTDEGAPFTAKGPLLYDVINACLPVIAPENLARMGVVVTGSDGYQSAFSWSEIAPEGSNVPVIVAVEYNGAPLRSIFLPAWVISPNDSSSLRSVFSIAKLDLINFGAAAAAQATPTA